MPRTRRSALKSPPSNMRANLNGTVTDNVFKLFVHGLSPTNERADIQPDILWEVDPPTLAEFVTSDAYLGLPPLSARQLRVFVEGVGEDGKLLFVTRGDDHEIDLVWGKGAGKDYIAAIFISYLTYVLLCMANPETFLGLAPRESVDIVNVATRAEQARDVFYTKLKTMLERPCFVRFHPQLNKMQATFLDKPVRLHSLHSRAQSWEGFNIIAWVMDEADAFQSPTSESQNAAEIYGVLRSSAVTRFPDRRWLGFVISYPRSERGWLMKHVAQQKKTGRAYTDIAATWEVHPHYDATHPSFKNFPMVKVYDEYLVPEPYVPDFEGDPSGSAMKFMCKPPPIEGAFFEYPDLITKCMNPLRRNAVESVLGITTLRPIGMDGTRPAFLGLSDEQREQVQRYTALAVPPNAWRPAEPFPYYLHGDPGEVHDSFALALAHTLPDTSELMLNDTPLVLNRVVIDFVLEWKPEYNKPVDLLNVRDIIMFICRHFGVRRVTFDKFQSTQVIQELMQAGIPAKSSSFSIPEQLKFYTALKSAVYHGTVEWSETAATLIEPQLRYLTRKGDKITHAEERKDIADAVAAVHYYASGAGMGKVGRQVLETIHSTAHGHQARIVGRRRGGFLG